MKSGPPQRTTPLKRGAWRRPTPGAAAASLRVDARPRKPLRPVSDKRRKRDAAYPKARAAAYERAEGRCEAPSHAAGCNGRAEECHHVAGRGGPDPHRLDNLKALSSVCHTYATEHPLWAYDTGVSRRRLGGAA